ncbi:hypothetical protein KEM48_012551 [Puccinia striiformis f. sp. tritici PST-130]|nr:hypothetical protein KEM48_012551 [Puccinia striiformis f. sp. tritici PST-130]
MSDDLSLSSSLPTGGHSRLTQPSINIEDEDVITSTIGYRISWIITLMLLDTVVSPSESGVMMVVNEEPAKLRTARVSTLTITQQGSVDYIKHLKHLLDLQSQRNNELEAELRRVRSTPESQQRNEKRPTRISRPERSDSPMDQDPDQQIEPQNQNGIRFEEENMMMMANEFSNGGNSFGPDDTLLYISGFL